MTPNDHEFDSLRHDLSQILWAIQGRARMIAANTGVFLGDQVAALLEDTAAAVAMVADVDRGPCDCIAVVRGAWRQALAIEASRSGAPVSREFVAPTCTVPVEVPAHALRRVLANLFTNALEAMPRGGGVHCTVSEKNGRLRLTVADDGPGLSAAALEHLFAPGATVGKPGGQGLGLAGARALLRRHGGDIEWVPRPLGAAFELDLPMAAVAMIPTADRPAVVRGGRLLVVDDDSSVRTMLADLLGLDDHRVTLASDHDSALAAFERGAYDAVLIDLGLAGRGGLELASTLRSLDPTVALIMLTGWGRERELAAVPAALVDFSGLKPLDLPELRDLLSRAIERTARRRAAFHKG